MRNILLLSALTLTLTACAPASVEDSYRNEKPSVTSSSTSSTTSERTTRLKHEQDMYVAVDPDTGCEYLIEGRSAATPRIASDGVSHKGCNYGDAP